MPPSQVLEPMNQERQLQTLTRAFDALLLTAHQLSCKERELQRKLKFAHKEYLKLARHIPGGSGLDENVIARQMLLDDAEQHDSPSRPVQALDVINTLRKSGQIGDSVLEAITAGLGCSRSIPSQQNPNDLVVRALPCLVAATPRPTKLEQDFTTAGVQGSLRCPFAKAHGVLSTHGNQEAAQLARDDVCGYEDLDPIKAEGRDGDSRTGSSARLLAPRCPIRYLDQHSPEEMLQYLENHKHDLPRSHEICIKRFQKDYEKARQIDVKYGDPTNMIQSLGEKHKAFLPDRAPNGASPTTSAKRVEEWAKDVSSRAEPETNVVAGEDKPDDPTDRSGHFERPLREIRVGESPSRPWGISVPIPYPVPENAGAPVSSNSSPGFIGSGKANDESSNSVTRLQDSSATSARPVANGLFVNGAALTGDPAPEAKQRPVESPHVQGVMPTHEINNPTTMSSQAMRRMLASPTKINFNGPVFIGYPADQAASLIQHINSIGASN